ncbi:MAG: type I methionyl aminopeptidase, partial [Omnitrophica bacterium RBG_13_46_9]
MTALLSEDQLDLVRKAGSIVRECLEIVSEKIKAGVSTKSLEKVADGFIASKNAKAAFRGYKGFPASICASINDTVVHGIPSEKSVLKDGDIISIDIGVEFLGFFADGATTVMVGKVPSGTERLVSVTKKALHKGIEKALSGNHVEDISWAIQSFAESHGFNVVRMFVGHGIGRHIHEPPEVPNFGRPHHGRLLENGMALAIEPMINVG